MLAQNAVKSLLEGLHSGESAGTFEEIVFHVRAFFPSARSDPFRCPSFQARVFWVSLKDVFITRASLDVLRMHSETSSETWSTMSSASASFLTT
jgi:hypothetical protein